MTGNCLARFGRSLSKGCRQESETANTYLSFDTMADLFVAKGAAGPWASRTGCGVVPSVPPFASGTRVA